MLDQQVKEIRLKFFQHHQEHCFKFWEILSQTEQYELLQQAKYLDLDYISDVIDSVLKYRITQNFETMNLLPASFIKVPESGVDWENWKSAVAIGEEKLRAGKVAAFTVAGGEGTRLGCLVPKGTLPVTPIRKKPLFQVFAEKIKAAEHKYETKIPWIIMTSERTHNETIAFFGKNNSFGVDDIHFIKQGLMPAITQEGKIIMETRSRIAMHPDGHGGSLKALGRSGMLSMLENLGIEILSYFQVDNPLARCIDPYLIGLHAQRQSQVTSRMVRKLYPEEKVGVFCEIDKKLHVVEYVDLPQKEMTLRDGAGNLVFCAGNTAIHILDLQFIKQFNGKNISSEIPYHIARKAIATIDDFGNVTIPREPNGLKLEMFLFDVFPFAERAVVVESERLGNFSPIKNLEGLDSLKTSAQDQLRTFAKWLLASGVDIPTDSSGLPPFDIEISPLFADNIADFRKKWAELEVKPAIGVGTYIE